MAEQTIQNLLTEKDKKISQLEKEVENLKLSINKERSTTIGMISQIARIFWGYDDDFNEEMHKIVANIDTNKSFLNQVDTLLALQSSLLVQSKKMHSFLGKLDQYLQDLSCSISKIESLPLNIRNRALEIFNNTVNVREIVKKDMPKGKRKGIIFSADVNSMDDDIKFIKEIYPNVEIKKLHSNMSYNEQKKVKQWFADAKSGYLCTIAMVNEGAHYDGVNTIFMLRKTTSELVFLQQLGRAITSVYGNSDPHTVVFDLVNSSKAIQNIKKK